MDWLLSYNRLNIFVLIIREYVFLEGIGYLSENWTDTRETPNSD